jgi:hypothetical protein
MRAKHDKILARIDDLNEANGGLVIQKAAKGYSLFREDTGRGDG